MRISQVLAVFTLLLLLAAPRAEAVPPNLSGSYSGKATCAGFADGLPAKFKFTLTVALDHDVAGNLIRGTFGFVNDEAALQLDGCGFVLSADAKPNRARSALGAGAAPLSAFFMADLAKVDVFPLKPSGKSGKLKGTLLFATRPNDMLSCKMTADRISAVDPGLSPCVEP